MGKEPRDPQGMGRGWTGFIWDMDMMVHFDALLGASSNFEDLGGLFMFGLSIVEENSNSFFGYCKGHMVDSHVH